ncbi:DUF3833 family protein [Aurantimonas sp. VKM B-3413]|uniref:DUF3833 family protein n=1 Tax=Aurantimonas sp. VKM B-3413 TaxID=2779401 RepID=UPI001E3094BA|nr:DUF3833 family protein [Aurantimonas sp. VKM B-3413]MCB8836652.1 DUF3833 domain-containing protein [Aurantimonas sp. VKM B-3413]
MSGRASRGESVFALLRRCRTGLLSALVILAGLAVPYSAGARSAAPAATDFSLLSFFDGRTYSRGETTTALVSTEAFTARFHGERQGDKFVLDERFRFKDATRLQHWELRRTPGGVYSGTVSTELETGRMSPRVRVKGQSMDGGVVLRYDGYAPGGGETLLGFRHVLTPQPDGTVTNHVTVSKFAIPVASSTVVFSKRRLPAGQS